MKELTTRVGTACLFLLCGLPLTLNADDATSQCCSCAFAQSAVWEPNEDFPCRFEYPAGWEARYIGMDNSVDIRAPRCETRCKGSRSIVFSVAQSKNNNFEYLEEYWHESALPVGRAECGGRVVTIFQSRETGEDTLNGAMSFFVGKNDDLSYDARLAINCPTPGEWQEVQTLIIDTLR